MLDLIIGRRELGKTTLSVHIARSFPTRILFDPRAMIHTSSVVLTDVSEVRGRLGAYLDSRAEIIVRSRFDVEGTFAAMCEEIYLWLVDNPDEPFCLLVDEARFVPHPEENPHFDFIVRCTPRSLVMVILTCHGIVDISADLRRVADFWVMFKITHEADLERIREQCGDIISLAVADLEPYQYVVWNDANGTFRKYTDRSRWHVSLEREVIAA